jgi:CO/xanthine dehydrogenase Mo-binding subunit
MSLDLEYQRAAEAALAADQAATVAHAALFDFARELGDLSAQLQARSAPLPLAVRFVRREPPRLDAPAGVRVEDAPKERPPSFASVVIETRDLFFAIESLPGIAIAAVTNVPALESYAATICGVRVADDGKPHLLARTADGLVGVPSVNTAGTLLEAFLVMAGDVFIARASFNPLPDV